VTAVTNSSLGRIGAILAAAVLLIVGLPTAAAHAADAAGAYTVEASVAADGTIDATATVELEGAPATLVQRFATTQRALDDRLYRFAGYFAKYALLKFHKRLEHQQRLDLPGLLGRFGRRGLAPLSHALVPAGFSWMNDARTKRLQAPFTAALAWLHRTLGLDLARDANVVLALRHGVAAGGPPPGARRVTHVCRECGEHAVIEATRPWPHRWACPWCGQPNPFGRPR